MRRLLVNTFLTLDGVMQAPGGPGEDDEGGFLFGGWTVPFWDDLMNEGMGEFMGHPFDLVLGRKTYDIFASYWPTAEDEASARPLNEATKYVASRSPRSLEWQNSVLLEGDVAEAVGELKRGDGPELQVHGSSDLLQTLIAADLIDEYRMWIFPVVLGSGKRLFGDGAVPRSLRLIESSVSTTGVLMGRYEPAGDVTVGSF